jgi:hypothetical protein
LIIFVLYSVAIQNLFTIGSFKIQRLEGAFKKKINKISKNIKTIEKISKQKLNNIYTK